MDLMDYVTTDEGQYGVRMGLEGIDWRRNGDELEIIREKDADGNFLPLSDKYPAGVVMAEMTVLADGWSMVDPSIPDYIRQIPKDMFAKKQENMNILLTDWDLYFFSAPNFNKYSINFGNEYSNLVVMDGDLETNWKAWVEQWRPQVDQVLAELNAQ
jgi:putative aldouronate transport system substrate-binding protein